jgi:hypothetical protein
MTDTSAPILQYRFKIPSRLGACITGSFGIEPVKLNSKGRTVKAGAAVVRIVIHWLVKGSPERAQEAAAVIADHLNAGGSYSGPKQLDSRKTDLVSKVHGYLSSTAEA